MQFYLFAWNLRGKTCTYCYLLIVIYLGNYVMIVLVWPN